MGLLSWVKNRYYQHKISSAYNAFEYGDISKSKEILESMFDKCPESVPALADIYLQAGKKAKTPDEVIEWTKKIFYINDFCTIDNKDEYKSILDSAVSLVSAHADTSYRTESFGNACKLLDSLFKYRSCVPSYDNRHCLYHTKRLLASIFSQRNYNSAITELYTLLQNHGIVASSVQNVIYDTCKDKSSDLDLAQRSIETLIELYPNEQKSLQECCKMGVFIIQNNIKITSIGSISKSTELCNLIAESLYREARNVASMNNFSVAVRYCELALPYLKKLKDFTKDYCDYRFEVATSPAMQKNMAKSIPSSINDIIRSAFDLELSQDYITSIKERTLRLSQTALLNNSYETAYFISSAFVGDDKSYKMTLFDSAKVLAKENNVVDYRQLQSCIEEESIIEEKLKYYSYFLPFCESYRTRLIELATESIISKTIVSPETAIAELEKMWRVCPSDIYIRELLNIQVVEDCLSDTIIANHQTYFSLLEAKNVYLDWVEKQNDEKALTIYEKLIIHKCEVNAEYAKRVASIFDNCDALEGRLALINRALSYYSCNDFYSRKFQCSKDYLEGGDYSMAIEISEQLIGHHKGAQVLIAKTNLEIGSKSSDLESQEKCYKAILDLERNHCDFFDDKAFAPICITAKSLYVELAKSFHSKGEPQKAYAICDSMAEYEPALIMLSSLKLKESESASSPISFLKATIKELKAYNCKAVYKDDSYSTIWEKYIDLCITEANSINDVSLLAGVQKSLMKEEHLPNQNVLDAKLVKKLLKLYKTEATEKEKSEDFATAISWYQIAKTLLQTPEASERMSYRIAICRVKNGDLNIEDDIHRLLSLSIKSLEKEKKDLTYRYALALIKASNLDLAIKFINSHLEHEDELKQAAANGFIVNQEKILSEFNSKLNAVKEGTLPAKEAIALVGNVDRVLDSCDLLASVDKNSRDSLRSVIKAYAMKKLLDEADYIKAISAMKKVYGIWPADENAARNMAVACMGIAEDRKLTNSNYKEIISLFISLVYQLHIFIKSLDYTSWDDPYTFSIAGALGKYDEGLSGKLPDNVTYDDPDDNANVIAIGFVQKSIIQRFESALAEHDTFQKFLNDEQAALDALLALQLDKTCDAVSPYMCQLDKKLATRVMASLDYEVGQKYDNWEDALDVGLKYGCNGSEFKSFEKALQYQQKCIESIKTLNKYKSSFTEIAIRAISQYQNLKKSMNALVLAKLNTDIKAEIPFKSVWECYSHICEKLGDQTLTFTFSRYVMQHIVQEVNANNMTPGQATPIIYQLYKLDTTNQHVKDNLQTLIGLLIHGYLSDSSNSSFLQPLCDVLKNTRVFDQKVIEEASIEFLTIMSLSGNSPRVNLLIRNLSDISISLKRHFQKADVEISLASIIKEANEGNISKVTTLERLYNLYTQYSSHQRTCQNLAIVASQCIFEYLMQDNGYSNKSKTKSIINRLANNRSATYNSNNSEISKTRRLLWDRLTYSNQQALRYHRSELTEQGRAMAEAFDYFDKIS